MGSVDRGGGCASRRARPHPRPPPDCPEPSRSVPGRGALTRGRPPAAGVPPADTFRARQWGAPCRRQAPRCHGPGAWDGSLGAPYLGQPRAQPRPTLARASCPLAVAGLGGLRVRGAAGAGPASRHPAGPGPRSPRHPAGSFLCIPPPSLSTGGRRLCRGALRVSPCLPLQPLQDHLPVHPPQRPAGPRGEPGPGSRRDAPARPVRGWGGTWALPQGPWGLGRTAWPAPERQRRPHKPSQTPVPRGVRRGLPSQQLWRGWPGAARPELDGAGRSWMERAVRAATGTRGGVDAAWPSSDRGSPRRGGGGAEGHGQGHWRGRPRRPWESRSPAR